MLVWAAALLVLVLFQKADWSVGPSLSGYVHRYAGFTAFVALPMAALAVGRGRPDRVAAGLCGLAVLAYGWLTVIVAGMLLYPLAGVPMWQVVPLGMVERALSLTEVAALTLLATTAYRAAPSAVDVRAGRGGTTGRRGRGSVLGEVAFRDVPAAGAADGAQHPAVVGDQQQRSGEAVHGLLQLLDRGQVEVVGRLVEHQQVDPAGLQQGQRGAGAFAG